jgi:hypothetical protein
VAEKLNCECMDVVLECHVAEKLNCECMDVVESERGEVERYTDKDRDQTRVT